MSRDWTLAGRYLRCDGKTVMLLDGVANPILDSKQRKALRETIMLLLREHERKSRPLAEGLLVCDHAGVPYQ